MSSPPWTVHSYPIRGPFTSGCAGPGRCSEPCWPEASRCGWWPGTHQPGALVDQAFTEQTVARLQPRIEQIADDLLDRLPPDGPADLIEDYAFPLAVTVICELLGVPAADRNDFRRWSKAIVASSPPDGAREPPAASRPT